MLNTLLQFKLCKQINKYLQYYLFAIIMVFVFGPLKWQVDNIYRLIIYLLLMQLSMYIGYNIAYNNCKRKYNSKNVFTHDQAMYKYINFMAIVNIVIIAINIVRISGVKELSFDLLIEKVWLGIVSPADMYREKFTHSGGNNNIINIITVLAAPFLWPIVPLSIVFFDKLKILTKVLLFLTIILESARWIIIGTNKGIVDLVIIISVSLVIKKCFNNYSNERKVKKTMKYKFLIILFLFLGVLYFVHSIGDRTKSIDYSFFAPNGSAYNSDTILLKVMPKSFEPVLVFSSVYLTQGYYGLSLIFDEEYVPMYGLGSSMFLMENYKELSNTDLYVNTYQSRIEYKGWDSLVQWHSIYTWLANDFSLFGVPLIMFLFGIFFGIISCDAIVYRNPIAISLLMLLILMCFYIPCNNQIMSYPTTFFAFWGLTIYWIYKRKMKYIIKYEH